MKRFIEGQDRNQSTLLPDCIEDYVEADNPVRAVDAFIDMLDLATPGFNVEPEATGRPGYHPATMLKLYLYGYLNQVQSSRRLERECGRNLELIWLTGRLVAHEVTNLGYDRDALSMMARAAKDVMATESVEAVADKGYYSGEVIVAVEKAGIAVTVSKPNTSNAGAAGRFDKADFVYVAADDIYICPAGERLTYRMTSEHDGKMVRMYWTSACADCPVNHRCTTGKERRVRRWEHEAILERVQKRLDDDPSKIPLRSKTVEHPFGTIKAWMGATHFRMKTLKHVATEMALHVLAYNVTRVMAIMGVSKLIEAMRT